MKVPRLFAIWSPQIGDVTYVTTDWSKARLMILSLPHEVQHLFQVVRYDAWPDSLEKNNPRAAYVKGLKK